MSLTALHSWGGLLFGCLLFAVFLTGTLTVFDTEITVWMQQPAYVRLSLDARDRGPTSLLATEVVYPAGERDEAPAGRPPLTLVKLQEKRTFSGQTLDPESGVMVTYRNTQGGDFFYHFHQGLLLGPPGAWIVGTGALAMLGSLVTGLGINRRGLKEVLMVWSRPANQRAWLDAHNLTGILVLPFHLLITVTGLVLLWSIAVPWDLHLLAPGGAALSLLSDLHVARLGGETLRWLYFVMGLAASVMIATGLILWTNKRRRHQAERIEAAGYRAVDVITVSTVAGLPVAVAAYLWANRLLPLALVDRPLWETGCFFLVWCGCVVHALLRRQSISAWKEQLSAGAVLLGLLPLLNGLTTESHLLKTIPTGQWEMAGFDLTASVVGLSLWAAARRVGASLSAIRTISEKG